MRWAAKWLIVRISWKKNSVWLKVEYLLKVSVFKCILGYSVHWDATSSMGKYERIKVDRAFDMIICLLLTQLLILPSQITSTNFIAQWKFMAKTLSLKMQCNRSRCIQENYTWGENRSINSGATGCLGGLTLTGNCNPRLTLKSVNSDLVFFVVDTYVPPLFLALWIP